MQHVVAKAKRAVCCRPMAVKRTLPCRRSTIGDVDGAVAERDRVAIAPGGRDVGGMGGVIEGEPQRPGGGAGGEPAFRSARRVCRVGARLEQQHRSKREHARVRLPGAAWRRFPPGNAGR